MKLDSSPFIDNRLRTYLRDGTVEAYRVIRAERKPPLRGLAVMPPCTMRDVLTFWTKVDAEAWCREHGWPLASVGLLSTRFQTAWCIEASSPRDPERYVIGSDVTRSPAHGGKEEAK